MLSLASSRCFSSRRVLVPVSLTACRHVLWAHGLRCRRQTLKREPRGQTCFAQPACRFNTSKVDGFFL
ncbi:hypothetical protein CesoFtcFv8_026663 [Champsocephalus esox]|uniref:Uncharacterized protein n=1 Tax=Champsocephalus esox TaxID=159716 RepID=A0AAN8AZJ4_9TELE|nr:hypothetical protein CesoFtcFv8_026663 [Champsocephalus esox]